MTTRTGRRHAVVLAVLAVLFLLRVLGQVLVAFVGVDWLPPMDAWYSGLLPYPLLLPAQIAILAVQAVAVGQLAQGRGALARPRRGLGKGLVAFAAIYAAAMAVRYALTMAWYPERRWLGSGTIPIAFHWVLAAWLFTLGRYHLVAACRAAR